MNAAPAFVAGTSSEFLGRKPLPRAVRVRPLVFLLGPRGVGKTSVATRLLGSGVLQLDNRALQDLASDRVIRGLWSGPAVTEPALIVDGPCFLTQRPGFAASVRSLLLQRVQAGLRTAVIEAGDQHSVSCLLEVVPPHQRATVLLRFPVGRGRRRYAARLCDELGLPGPYARRLGDLDPWSYDRVRDALLAVHADRRST